MSVSDRWLSSPLPILKRFRKFLDWFLELLIRFIFFWEEDDKRLGRILRYFHQMGVMGIVVCQILVHTVFPSQWFLFGLWVVMCIVSMTQLLTGGCALTRIEQRFTGEKVTIVDPLLDLFHLEPTHENTMGITLLFGVSSFVFLTFEVMSRTLLNIQNVLPHFLTPRF